MKALLCLKLSRELDNGINYNAKMSNSKNVGHEKLNEKTFYLHAKNVF